MSQVISALVFHAKYQWFEFDQVLSSHSAVEMGSWFILELGKEGFLGVMLTIPPSSGLTGQEKCGY